MKNKKIIESSILNLRAELIAIIRQYINDEKLTQNEAAEKFSVTQPRISDLVRGKVNLFAIDSLIQMLNIAGYKVEFKITKQK